MGRFADPRTHVATSSARRERLAQIPTGARQPAKKIRERQSRIALQRFRVVHTGDSCQLSFEMENDAKIWIVRVQISESATKEREEFRLVMIGLCADFDQLDKIRGSLRPPKIFADTAKRILQRNFRQGMQVRLPAARDLDFCFEEEIQFTREWTFRAPGAPRDGLNAA